MEALLYISCALCFGDVAGIIDTCVHTLAEQSRHFCVPLYVHASAVTA